ncbi:50S ribosomal protein L16 chloroplastic [Bienertia sinuspersici]
MKGYQRSYICFGRYALQALEPTWITSRQIKARQHAETHMGLGNGSPKYRVVVAKPSRILYEISGVVEYITQRDIAIKASKMPIRIQFF